MLLENRKTLLLALSGLLCVLAALIVWNLFYSKAAFFEAGTRPDLITKAPDITLPPGKKTDPMRGATSTSAVRITLFSDITCLSCRVQEREIRQLMAEYPDQVQWIWRDAPQPAERPDAIIAASALRCAKDQNRFWELHDLLNAIPLINLDTILAQGKRLPLNQLRFEDCIRNGLHISEVSEESALAKKHNIETLPTTFIESTAFVGVTSAAQLRWTLQKDLLFKR